MIFAAALALTFALPVCADDVASFLEERGLMRLLSVHLEIRLQSADPQERAQIIPRLASLYSTLLESTTDENARKRLEQRSRELLAAADADAADELRLALLRGTFRRVERAAENHRLRMADESALAQARQDLRGLTSELYQIRARLAERSETAERRLMRSGGADAAMHAAAIQEVQSLLSQANFLLGWTLYYESWLNGTPESARAAQPLFAEILDISPDVTRPRDVTEDLRGMEPIARSILGMGLCRSITSSYATAIEWIELLEHEQTHPETRAEVPAWKLAVLLQYGEFERAADLFKLLAERNDPMPLSWVRLAAVWSLEAAESEAADALANLAVNELASRGELQQILALVERYGIEKLGRSGFALRYVRAVQLYERARSDHGNERPTSDKLLRSLYSQAASELKAAIEEPDAQNFSAPRASALWLIGWCEYFQSELLRARQTFQEAAESLADEQAAESLWMAIVCLDQLADAPRAERFEDEIATLIEEFLDRFPTNPRAARLVLRQSLNSTASMDQVRKLLAVAPEDESYLDSRRVALAMLYDLFRNASSDAGGAAGGRAEIGREFLDVAGDVLSAELTRAESGDDSAADRFLLVARQSLEIALDEHVDEPTAIHRTMNLVQAFAASFPDRARPYEAEFAFRQLQAHLRTGNVSDAEALGESLWREHAHSPWPALASQNLLAHAVAIWKDVGTSRADLRDSLDRIVTNGLRILGSAESGPVGSESQLTILTFVAQASFELWKQFGDPSRGRAALPMFERLLNVRPRDAGHLRAAAELAEHFGDVNKAVEYWRILGAGHESGSDKWLEARYHLLRLLSEVDPPRAREVVAQHKAMNPNYGPEPWGSRLRALDEKLQGNESNAPTPEAER